MNKSGLAEDGGVIAARWLCRYWKVTKRAEEAREGRNDAIASESLLAFQTLLVP